jgi:uncharacterized hydrophobic protein (TIGR00341 family)
MVKFVKEVKIIIPKHREEVIEGLVAEFNLDSSVIEGRDQLIYFILISEDESNNLLHQLKIRGVGTVFGDVRIVTLNTVLRSSKLENKVIKSQGANVEEILSVLEGPATINLNYIALVILSAILAAFGLVDENVVIIIGAMIVAPLMGPIALTSLGAITPGRGYLFKGFVAESLGITLTVIVGFIVGQMVRIKDVEEYNREIASRTVLSETVVIFALVSGIAAGIIIVKGSNLSIVGVAIAASLAPPAANIGLLLAANDISNAINTSILLTINILSINFACSLIFLLFGLASKSGTSKRQSEIASRSNRIITFSVGLTLMIMVILIIFYSDLFIIQPN